MTCSEDGLPLYHYRKVALDGEGHHKIEYLRPCNVRTVLGSIVPAGSCCDLRRDMLHRVFNDANFVASFGKQASDVCTHVVDHGAVPFRPYGVTDLSLKFSRYLEVPEQKVD